MSVGEASLGSGEGAGRFCPSLFWLPLRQSLALPLVEGTCWLWSLFPCLGLLTLGWKAPGSGVLGIVPALQEAREEQTVHSTMIPISLKGSLGEGAENLGRGK